MRLEDISDKFQKYANFTILCHFPREVQLQNDFLLSSLLTEYD